MSKGFIKLHRSIMGNDFLYGDKPFNNLAAWVDLLLLAEYEDNVYQGKERKRGEVHRSQRWLANRWGWSVNKVRRFLAELERNTKVVTNGTRNGTVITLVNYGVYQSQRNTKRNTNEYTNELQLRNIKNNGTPKSTQSSLRLPKPGEILRDDP